MGKVLDIAGGVISSGAGALIDTALGGIQQNRIDEQNRKNLQYQKDLWDYTNAENQVKHYKNAGLNVGLMYESGGNSTSTGSFGTGQSQVGKLDIAQNLIAQKQIELIDAQTDKTKAEAENLRGVERENKATQTLDLLQGIENKKAQETLTKIQSDIAGVDKQIKNETYEEAVEFIKGMTSYQSQQIDQLRYSNAVDKATVNEKVAKIKAELSSILLQKCRIKCRFNVIVIQVRVFRLKGLRIKPV